MPILAATATFSGPLLTGPVEQRVTDLVDRLTWEIGAQALAEWHELLDRSIRQPTPYYETQLTLQRVDDGVLAHDRGVIYGPWLEGTSRRNRRSVFKGYHAARMATLYTKTVVHDKAQPVLARWVEEVG
jgi:hypothetical protein